jgi:hypothetical protein
MGCTEYGVPYGVRSTEYHTECGVRGSGDSGERSEYKLLQTASTYMYLHQAPHTAFTSYLYLPKVRNGVLNPSPDSVTDMYGGVPHSPSAAVAFLFSDFQPPDKARIHTSPLTSAFSTAFKPSLESLVPFLSSSPLLSHISQRERASSS